MSANAVPIRAEPKNMMQNWPAELPRISPAVVLVAAAASDGSCRRIVLEEEEEEEMWWRTGKTTVMHNHVDHINTKILK